jgi:hypothetical protein
MGVRKSSIELELYMRLTGSLIVCLRDNPLFTSVLMLQILQKLREKRGGGCWFKVFL